MWMSFLISVLCLRVINAASVDGQGVSCTTRDVPGTCVPRHRCTTLIYDVMAPEHIRARQEPETCPSVDGEPYVCCTACKNTLVNNISDAVYAPTGALYWRNGEKWWDKCLQYSDQGFQSCRWCGQDWGGVDKEFDKYDKCHYLTVWENSPSYHLYETAEPMFASIHQVTHAAILGYGSSETPQWLCGAALISDKYLLTSASCVTVPGQGTVSHALLGVQSINAIVTRKLSDCTTYHQRHDIKRAVLHPEYSIPSGVHDIALLETKETVRFTCGVSPACLTAPAALGDLHLAWLTAVEWDITSVTTLLPNITDEKIYLLDDDYCSSLWSYEQNSSSALYNSTMQGCYGEYNLGYNSGLCKGGSGSPIQTTFENLCIRSVVGVTTYARNCGKAAVDGGFTKVAPHVAWIESVVWT